MYIVLIHTHTHAFFSCGGLIVFGFGFERANIWLDDDDSCSTMRERGRDGEGARERVSLNRERGCGVCSSELSIKLPANMTIA